MIYNTLKNLFKGVAVREVNSGLEDGAVRWKQVSINGDVISDKFKSYPNENAWYGFTSYYIKNLVLCADQVDMVNLKVMVKGKEFSLVEKNGKKGKYYAIYDGKAWKGNFFEQSRSCYFKNVCL